MPTKLETELKQEQSIGHRVFQWGAFIVLIGTLVVMGWIAWSVLYEPEIVEFTQEYMTVLNNPTFAGDNVYYEVPYCKSKDIPARVSRELINGEIINYPSFISTFELGCHTELKSLIIPPYAPSGDNYKVRTSIEFRVNPLKSVYKTIESEPFTVVNTGEELLKQLKLEKLEVK